MAKKLMITAALAMLFLTGAVAMACPGGVYKLNDDTELLGDALRDVSDNQVVSVTLFQTGRKIPITDSQDRNTHEVTILWVEKDSQGIFYTIYQVRDLGKKTTKTIKVKTNYMGGGMVARGISPDFTIDEEYGCGSR